MSTSSLELRRWWAIALAGPALEGAILGLRGGPRAMVAMAVGLPLIVAGVTALTTPTLYVGGALFGGRLSLAQVGAATARALHALGLVCLGLVPLNLLLALTWSEARVAPAQAVLLLVVALVLALGRLAAELRDRAGDAQPLAGGLLFAAHSLVCGVLGTRLFFDLLAFTLRVSS
jgi:hypothetical protein